MGLAVNIYSLEAKIFYNWNLLSHSFAARYCKGDGLWVEHFIRVQHYGLITVNKIQSKTWQVLQNK